MMHLLILVAVLTTNCSFLDTTTSKTISVVDAFQLPFSSSRSSQQSNRRGHLQANSSAILVMNDVPTLSRSNIFQMPEDDDGDDKQQQKQQKKPQTTKEKQSLLATVGAVLHFVVGTFLRLEGLGRTLKFWRLVLPIFRRYKYTKFRARNLSEDEQNTILQEFHQRYAPHVQRGVLEMGGILIKLAQITASIGTGLFPDAYVQSMQALLDGVPPRSYDEIVRIIEASTGKSMDDLFVEFEATPIGAASIAQAHLAVLKNGDGAPVVVKVQYPDVAALFLTWTCTTCGLPFN